MTEQQQQHDEQASEEYATGWKPTAGDRIVGTVVDIAATDMGYGPYAIVTLKTATGEIAVHAFHTVLRRELARRRPKVGDQLDITYVGKKSDGGGYGKGYDMYRVKSDKDSAGYDWDRDMPTDTDSADERESSVPIEPSASQTAEAEPAPAVTDDGSDLPF